MEIEYKNEQISILEELEPGTVFKLKNENCSLPNVYMVLQPSDIITSISGKSNVNLKTGSLTTFDCKLEVIVYNKTKLVIEG